MPDANYWSRFGVSRLSRRNFARGALLTTGAAGLTLAGCSSSKNSNKHRASTTATQTASASASAVASSVATKAAVSPTADSAAIASRAGSSTPTAGAGLFPAVFGQYDPRTQGRAAPTSTGGTLRRFAYTMVPLDTLDPHQTTFGPTCDLHSAVFSKLLAYDDLINQHVSPDLAMSLPEQPDQTTYILKLNPNAVWQSNTPLNANNPIAGQQVTADDVKYSIMRQVNRQSPKFASFQRSYQWDTVDSMQVMEPQTLQIKTKAPVAPFVHFMADSHAFIISQKLVDPAKDEMNTPSLMIGSGPFILENFQALKLARFVKNPTWHLKDAGFAKGRPFLDAIEDSLAPQDDATIEGALRAKQVDGAGWNDQTSADRVGKELIGTRVVQSPITGMVRLGFACDHGPMKDQRLRQAVAIALDRQAIGNVIFHGYYKFSPAVGWPMSRWTLPQEELLQTPGYRYTNQSDRDTDIKQAQQLLAAAGGPATIGGPNFAMWYTNLPAYIATFYPQLQKNMADTLQLKWTGTLDDVSVTKQLMASASHKVDWYFGYDNGCIDLDDWLWKYFDSKAPPADNTFGLADPDLDALLDATRAEFDFSKRQQLGYQAQRMLLPSKLAPRADTVNAVVNSTLWNYVKNSIEIAPWFGLFYLWANTWLDSNDPSYAGRLA